MPSTTKDKCKLSPPTFTNFVKHLGSGSPHCAQKLNVTSFASQLRKLLKESRIVGLKTTVNNLERIRRYNDFMEYKLKGVIDSTLLRPLAKEILYSEQHDGRGDGELASGIDLLRKNDKISASLRDIGNEFYKQKNFGDALKCYTLACCYAIKNSKVGARAFANRSACYLETNELERCLRDIEKFEQILTTFSEKEQQQEDNEFQTIVKRISDRKNKCLNKIKDNRTIGPSKVNVDFAKQYFELKEPSKIIPCAENFIGIGEDKVMGRYVYNIGEETVVPGTLIVLEKPYAQILLNNYSFNSKYCIVCLADLDGYGGYPCDSCIFTMYCSEECATSPKAALHLSYECKISHFLYELNMSRILYLSFSTLLELGASGIISHFASLENANKPTLPIAGFSESGIYDSSSYDSIHKLIYHDEILSIEEITKYCTDSVILAEILDHCTDFFSGVTNYDGKNDLRNQFSSLLLLHQENYPCNAHSLCQMGKLGRNPTPDKIKKTAISEIGSGAFSLLSMVNHSCDPNVVRITLKGGINALITIRHIVKGQEILDNYGSHYALDGREARHQNLTKMYNFTCICSPCKYDWPDFPQMSSQPDDSCIKICSVCRLKHDDNFDFKQTELLPVVGDEGKLSCTVCQHKVSQSDWWKEFDMKIKECQLANEFLVENNEPVKAFMKSAENVKYFDINCMKPFKLLNWSQEVMKQSLFILAKYQYNE